jgi:hypothetical protein
MIRQAIQVSGLCRRGGQFAPGGMFCPASGACDSVAWKASVDSLDALGVPITYGVRVDSMMAYISELAYVRTKSNASFAVERWNGTSLSLAAARDSLIGQVGINRFDTVLMGGNNDWTATELKFRIRAANGVYSSRDTFALVKLTDADSIAGVISLAGYSGVSQDAEADSGLAGTSAPGTWTAQQRVISVPALYGWRPQQYLMGLTFPGFNPRGATQGHGYELNTSNVTASASTVTNDSTYNSHYMQRTMWGAVMPYWEPDGALDWPKIKDPAGTLGGVPWFGEPLAGGGLYLSISTKARFGTGTNLVRITSSSLGGGQWFAASPNRPGFYQVKYTVNALRAVNALAGRALCLFVTPDQLTPKDIAR